MRASKNLLIMELRFEAMLYSIFGHENSDAGHIRCSPRSRLAPGATGSLPLL